MTAPLTSTERRRLKARAQHLEPTLKVGKQGLSAAFLAAVAEALRSRHLIKVKFAEFKEQKQELAPLLAEKTGSHLVTLVGHVAVLYRPQAEAATQAVTANGHEAEELS